MTFQRPIQTGNKPIEFFYFVNTGWFTENTVDNSSIFCTAFDSATRIIIGNPKPINGMLFHVQGVPEKMSFSYWKLCVSITEVSITNGHFLGTPYTKYTKKVGLLHFKKPDSEIFLLA